METTPQCWVWDVNPVIWSGPIDIRWYSVFFVLVFLLGWALLRWQLKRGGHKPQLAMDFIIWAMVGVVAGGWLGHQFFYRFDAVMSDPSQLIPHSQIRGLSSHGSTIGLVLALILFGRRHHIPMFEMIDRFTFSATGGAILVRVGNLFNSEILGRPTDVSWAFCFLRKDNPPLPRHPSQLYEVGLGLVVMGILFLTDRLAGREKRPQKLMGGVFFVGYFTLRFVVEFFKDHQTLRSNSALTMGQYLSIPFVVLGIVLILQARKAAAATAPSPRPSAPTRKTTTKKRKAGKKGKKRRR
jgi:prolipoprotein diacylglyceryl transferase